MRRGCPVTLPTVVIPVYNAAAPLRACLDSLEACSPEAPVLLVDDASSDASVVPMLRAWCAISGRRRLLANARNRGFVHTANRGMREAAGDVVLLNSDTVVTPGWLEALVACLASDARIATATPWTNNGEIVSFPEFCRAAPVPDDPAAIAAAIHAAGPPAYPDLPTAVGFCMAIARRAIERIGLFDEASFGRGYGEENDFSLRAAAAGMRNVLCDDAYVAHLGGGSFSPLGLTPDAQSMARLLRKHPGYQALVEDFIRRDPLAGRRAQLARAVQRASAGIS